MSTTPQWGWGKDTRGRRTIQRVSLRVPDTTLVDPSALRVLREGEDLDSTTEGRTHGRCVLQGVGPHCSLLTNPSGSTRTELVWSAMANRDGKNVNNETIFLLFWRVPFSFDLRPGEGDRNQYFLSKLKRSLRRRPFTPTITTTTTTNTVTVEWTEYPFLFECGKFLLDTYEKNSRVSRILEHILDNVYNESPTMYHFMI